MRALAWIPYGLVIGFLMGFGVELGPDLLPLLALTFVAAGYALISGSGIFDGDGRVQR
jgi:hypothetical protein